MAAVTTPTARLRRLDSPLAQAVAVAILIAISLVVRLAVNTRFQAPTILTDELTYAQMAENVANGDLWQGGYGLVYPLLLAPAWALADSGVEAYTWMKAINALLVSLTAIPVFLWARRLMRPAYALTAVALTLLLPAMAFSGHVMTDTPFILAVTVAAWAVASALERPTIARQALALIAIAVALGTRSQAIALLPAIPLAILLLTAADARSDGFSLRGWGARLARFWPLAVVGVAGVAALAARSVANGGQWRDLFQAYAIATTGQYKAETVARYYVWHLGEAAFAVGVIPVAALLVLVGMAILNRSRSSAERAYLATAVAVIATVALLVATFASYWSERVIERNMMCLFPLVMIGFALWLDRSLPRPARTTGIAAAITAVVVVSVPFAFLYQRSPSTETWAVVLPDLLTRRLPGSIDTVQIAIVAGVAVALLLFGFLRPRIAVVALPLLLAGYFVASQAAAVHTVGKTAAAYRNVPGLGADASWIDRLVGPDATVAFVSGSNLGTQGEQISWWETGFFNRADLQWAVW
ncbi:MAG: glycosyltransferase family 39 protein, partial [Gemmatimonadetes bacterium]|nr:glycosyltransferase family 39 protein [Gemmatimonadota bacterium]